MAVWSLVVEYIDLYWIVMPTYYKNGPQLHWLDLATLGDHGQRLRPGVLEPVHASTRWCRWAICGWSRACILRTRKEDHDERHG